MAQAHPSIAVSGGDTAHQRRRHRAKVTEGGSQAASPQTIPWLLPIIISPPPPQLPNTD